MSKFIVLFEDNKQPRVLHGVDPSQFDQSKILVNPVLPRGIPPHLWLKGNNCIEVMTVKEVIANVIPIKRPSLFMRIRRAFRK